MRQRSVERHENAVQPHMIKLIAIMAGNLTRIIEDQHSTPRISNRKRPRIT